MIATKKYHSTPIDQQRLQALSIKVMERFDEIMSCLNISLKKHKKMYVGPCPIHGGDKFNAVNIYHEGEAYVGNWKCRTQQCHKHFVGSVIGFVRGVLSHNKYNWTGPGDQMVTFNETIDFISKCLDEDYSSIDIDFVAVEKSRWVKNAAIYSRDLRKPTSGISRVEIRKLYNIPANYFVERGFNPDILDRYDVGLCTNPADLFNFNRIVVPIYDDNHKLVIGNTSRSIFERCETCKTWHNPKQSCPLPNDEWKFSKWKHSSGLKKEEHLYNYWFASQHIKANGVAILTESPGNIWRLEESGIHVGLATLGADFSDGQKHQLDKSGALTVIIIMDNDKAGLTCSQEVAQACKNTYKIYTFVPPKNDIGDMTVEEIQQTILPLYHSCVKEWKL